MVLLVWVYVLWSSGTVRSRLHAVTQYRDSFRRFEALYHFHIDDKMNVVWNHDIHYTPATPTGMVIYPSTQHALLYCVYAHV